jgi:kynurenine formamidase
MTFLPDETVAEQTLPDATLPGLWPLVRILRTCRFVDLTHGFSAETPHSPDFGPARIKQLYGYEDELNGRPAGFLAHEFSFAGQYGTHVDPPGHFHRGMRLLDELPVAEMVLPLAVLDITAAVERDPDSCVGLADLERWETVHGRVPAGAFVALRSGWSRRWPSQERMLNRDTAGIRHSPGWSLAALRKLFEERDITACGHETIDTDPGLTLSLTGEGPLERYVLGRDRWQIELMANLDEVPEVGAMLVASWPKAIGASGFPARIFAIHGQNEAPDRHDAA